MTKHKWTFSIPSPVLPFWIGRYFTGWRMQRCCYRCAYQLPFPDWMHLGFPYVKRSYWLSVALGCFHPQRNGASIPQKSCPQGLSLSSHTSACPPGRPHEGNTWHPKAARRNPRTVGDAGAAPVTIIRTHPPRLACGREESAKVCASGSGV